MWVCFLCFDNERNSFQFVKSDATSVIITLKSQLLQIPILLSCLLCCTTLNTWRIQTHAQVKQYYACWYSGKLWEDSFPFYFRQQDNWFFILMRTKNNQQTNIDTSRLLRWSVWRKRLWESFAGHKWRFRFSGYRQHEVEERPERAACDCHTPGMFLQKPAIRSTEKVWLFALVVKDLRWVKQRDGRLWCRRISTDQRVASGFKSHSWRLGSKNDKYGEDMQLVQTPLGNIHEKKKVSRQVRLHLCDDWWASQRWQVT